MAVLEFKNRKIIPLLLVVALVPILWIKSRTAPAVESALVVAQDSIPLPGAYNFEQYLPLLKNKRVAVVANQTSRVGQTHLVDTLLSVGVNVVRIFAPEHGFRGNVGAGDKVDNGVDAKTGLKLISLYGENKKPQKQYLADVDVLVFDIQDVGVRYYTYLSTLHYVMEAAAENNIQVVVLDRPNPNIQYIDGPVMQKDYYSFIGLHPVPLVYGMTIGEYAKMINGEGWLKNQAKADLTVVNCNHYTRSTRYTLPVPPSPNLSSWQSVYLYPSLGFFEGTRVSVGRGTLHPFTVIGQPANKTGNYVFTPVSMPGAAPSPLHEGEVCRGYNLIDDVSLADPPHQINLNYLLRMYRESTEKEHFFINNNFFEKLAGTGELRGQVIAQIPADSIRQSWQQGLNEFKTVRARYLIYPNK